MCRPISMLRIAPHFHPGAPRENEPSFNQNVLKSFASRS